MNTASPVIFLLFIGILEVLSWDLFKHLCRGSLDVFHGVILVSFQGTFRYRQQEEVAGREVVAVRWWKSVVMPCSVKNMLTASDMYDGVLW